MFLILSENSRLNVLIRKVLIKDVRALRLFSLIPFSIVLRKMGYHVFVKQGL